MSAAACETCKRPETVCVCDRVEKLATRVRVLVLQHPQERDFVLGSAQLLLASLPKAKVSVGLSWRSLGQALERDDVDPARWAVIFPDKDAPTPAPGGFSLRGRGGAPLDPARLQGVVVLDGSWSQAKTLWWRNPWLVRLPRLSLQPTEPSIYGALRHEPKRQYVSTLEAVADALVALGEPPETRAALRRLFRTMAQRARDAGLGSKKKRASK